MAIHNSLRIIISLMIAICQRVTPEGRCTEEDFVQLGIKGQPVGEDSISALGVIRSSIMKWITQKHSITPRNSRMNFATKLQRALFRNGTHKITPFCIFCIVKQAQCVKDNCYEPCSTDEYSTQCIRCVDGNCHRNFAKCLGMDSIALIDPNNTSLT